MKNKIQLNNNIKINVFPICKVCQFYEEDYLDAGEYGQLKGEWCHNNNNKYSFKGRRIWDITECDGFKENVEYTLKNIEREYNITILYAVESGSRVWGFANENSDFDIRFIFKYNDLKNYININNKYKDVLQFQDDIYDIVGWDIKKALYSHSKSNPSLYEWFNSEYIYVNNINNILTKLPNVNKKVLLHHYYNMADNHWNKYCKEWEKQVDLYDLTKKFLYIIRCILIWELIYRDKQEPIVSLDIHQLIGANKNLNNEDEEVYDKINWLCHNWVHEDKKDLNLGVLNDEYVDSYNVLEKWIESNLFFMKESTVKYKNNNIKNYELYNEVLYKLLGL